MPNIPVDNNGSSQHLDPLYRRKYHEGEIEYRLRSENRSRFEVWYLPLFSLGILTSSLLIEDRESLSIFTLILISFIISVFGKIAQNQLFWDVRDLQDIRDVNHQGRLERHRNISKYLPDKADEEIEVNLINSLDYFAIASQNWRTHLGLLSPTDTGKTSTLEYFMSLYTANHRTLFIAIEPKDNKWSSLPFENVFRISISPTIAEYNILINLLDWVIELAEKRKLGIEENAFEVILNLEEYLTTFQQIKVNPSLGAKQANLFISKIKALHNVGRSLGIHIVMISQSPVADDLGMSGGSRSNMRLLMLGSKLGGFDAIERNMRNSQLVATKEAQDSLKAQYDYYKPRLKRDRQPLLMTNLIDGWNIFPMPVFSDEQLSKFKIKSISVKEFPDLYEILKGKLFSNNFSVRVDDTGHKSSVTPNFSNNEFIGDIYET